MTASYLLIAVLFLSLLLGFALAAFAIMSHHWLGLIIVTVLILLAMVMLDREVTKLRSKSDKPDSTTDSKSSH